MTEKVQLACFASFAPWCSFGSRGGPLRVSMETGLSGWLWQSLTGNLYSQKQVVRFTLSQSAVKIFSMLFACGSQAQGACCPAGATVLGPSAGGAGPGAVGSPSYMTAGPWGCVQGRRPKPPAPCGKAGQRALIERALHKGLYRECLAPPHPPRLLPFTSCSFAVLLCTEDLLC